MTEPNSHITDTQNEKIIESLTSEMGSLKLQITKKDDRISTGSHAKANNGKSYR